MPDPDPTPAPVGYSWQQLARDVLSVLQIIALAYVARVGTVVENRQEQVKTTLEKKASDEKEGTRTLLWNAYTQLLWRAEETGKQKDKDKAAEAKRVYDDWVALMNGD